MAIRVLPTRDAVANFYGSLAPYLAAFTGDPGTAGNATNEVFGGSPAYTRKALAWSTAAGGTGVINGSATLDIPAGDTVTYCGVCASASPGTNDVVDNVAVTPQSFASQGTYAVSASFTEA